MKLGRRTPLAARWGTPFAGACAALLLLGVGCGATPRTTNVDTEKGTEHDKMKITFALEQVGEEAEPVVHTKLHLNKNQKFEVHNDVGVELTLSFPDYLDDESAPQSAGETQPMSDQPPGSNPKKTLAAGESATLKVKGTTPDDEEIVIDYSYQDPSSGMKIEGSADPIIVVLPGGSGG